MPPSSSIIARFCARSSGTPLANFISLTEPFGPPSPLAPLSETTTIMRVLELAALLEIVEQPPDVVVGVPEEAGVDLGHAANSRFSSSLSESHGPGVVELRERLAVRVLCASRASRSG